MKRPLLFLMLLLGLTLASCDDGEGGITLRLTVQPEDYFDLFPFQVDWIRERTERVVSPEDGGEYRSALAKLRAEGMGSLSPDERRLLMRVNWYVSVIQTETIRYQEAVYDSEGKLIEFTRAEEVYNLDVDRDSSAPYLLASREEYVEKEQPQFFEESVSQYQVVDDLGEDDAVLTAWFRNGDTWLCQRVRASGPYISLFLHRDMPPEFSSRYVEPEGIEEVRGREAYRFKAAASSSIVPFPEYLWLDVETLYPVQERYDEGLGRYSIKTVLEINGDVVVQPPELDTPCTEMDYGKQ